MIHATPTGSFGLYGLVGIAILLLVSIIRLSVPALEGLRNIDSVLHISFLIMWSVFMYFSEGNDGFKKRFVPRVIARASTIGQKSLGIKLIAPLYCMSLISDTRKQMLKSYIAITLIVCAVIAVRTLPQPWRGIIDSGVIIGLATGIFWLLKGLRNWLKES